MAQDGLVNVGQLLRERHAGEGVCWSASRHTGVP